MTNNKSSLNLESFVVADLADEGFRAGLPRWMSCAVDTFLKYFSREDILFVILDDVLAKKRVVVAKHDKEYVCELSIYLLGRNYLYFECGERSFFVVQANSVFHGIIFLFDGVAVMKREAASKTMEGVVALEKHIGLLNYKASLPSDDCPVIVNGYTRPYHDFYDRLPFIVHACGGRKVKFVGVSPFLNVGDYLGGSETDNDIESDEGINSRYKLPLLISAPLASKKKKDVIREEFCTLVSSKVSSSSSTDLGGEFTLWLGDCDEKRSVHNLRELYESIVRFVTSLNCKVVIVVDGLTARHGKSFGVRDACSYKRFGAAKEVVVKDVSDCDSEEKIAVAKQVDFFVSNGLTDSIWCAYFNRIAGVCYSSVSSFSEVEGRHHHFSTFHLPRSLVCDLTAHRNPTRDEFRFVLPDASSFICLAMYQVYLKKRAFFKYILKSGAVRLELKAFPVLASSLVLRVFGLEGRVSVNIHFLSSVDYLLGSVKVKDRESVEVPPGAFYVAFDASEGDVVPYPVQSRGIHESD